MRPEYFLGPYMLVKCKVVEREIMRWPVLCANAHRQTLYGEVTHKRFCVECGMELMPVRDTVKAPAVDAREVRAALTDEDALSLYEQPAEYEGVVGVVEYVWVPNAKRHALCHAMGMPEREMWMSNIEWRGGVGDGLWHDRGAEVMWFSVVYHTELTEIIEAFNGYADISFEWGVVVCEEH